MTRRDSRSALAGNLLLGLGSVLFALLIFGAVEAGLRIVGIGAPDASNVSRLKYQQIFLPLLEPATRPDGTPILRTVDPRLPYQAIMRDKPANAMTVVTFGGSAMAGLGFSPNVTFSRHLERMLRRAYPGRIVEVLNLGIVALSSKQVKFLVSDECQRYQADLIVVYSGNNEFLEIHAEKYAAAHANLLTRLRDLLIRTHLYRLVNLALRGPPRRPSLAEHDFSREDLRLTQRAIVRDIEMTGEEVKRVVEDYRANLEAIADHTSKVGIPLVLMTVASNLKWRGREDLPSVWLDALIGQEDAADPDRSRRAYERIDRELADSRPSERHEWLFRRAVIAEGLGDFDQARASYRAAMNEDPHLRRALDVMNDQVAEVARRPGVTLVDTVDLLQRHAKNGIVGFDEFYDYVHFTPRGAVLVAVELFGTISRMPGEPAEAALDAHDYTRERIDHLGKLVADDLALEEWMGFGFDRAQIADRDLWKYDRLLIELDRRIEEDPDDWLALAYRGNALAFRIDGAAGAARDYRAAIERAPDHPILRANLERLLTERGP